MCTLASSISLFQQAINYNKNAFILFVFSIFYIKNKKKSSDMHSYTFLKQICVSSTIMYTNMMCDMAWHVSVYYIISKVPLFYWQTYSKQSMMSKILFL